MDIKFIGPAKLSEDGGVEFKATVDQKSIICYFSYECLEDLDPDDLIGEALTHFTKHQLKLLSIAENKILQGHSHSGRVEIYSNDLN
jgi:hypothetical protein